MKEFLAVLKAYKETETVYRDATNVNRLLEASKIQMEAEKGLVAVLPEGTEGKVHLKYNGRLYQLDIWGVCNYTFEDITPDHVIDIPKSDPESDPDGPKSDPETQK